MSKAEYTKNLTEDFNRFPRNLIAKERSHVPSNVAELIRGACLLIGAGFFSIILLIGMDIAMQSTSMLGGLMVMGLVTLMSTLVSILTYYTTSKTFQFKREAEKASYFESPTIMEQMQKLLETAKALQTQ